MNFSTGNISKPTPRIPRAIGNAIVFMCLAIQPIIAQADATEMSHKARFYWSLAISALGGGTKAFSMMLAEDEKQPEGQEGPPQS